MWTASAPSHSSRVELGSLASPRAGSGRELGLAASADAAHSMAASQRLAHDREPE
jgi:hypothetical protein